MTEERKKTVTQIPVPNTTRQVREFLGTAGFFLLQIPVFASLAAPLYPPTKETAPFEWGQTQQQAFDNIKGILLSAPALSLPDFSHPFELYINERNGVV